MPTIAAINGYTQEAGVMLGLSHDYLTLKKGIRCLQLSLLAKQMALPAYFAALIRSKVAYPLAYRNFVLCDLHYDTKAAAKIHILETKPEPGNNALNGNNNHASNTAYEKRNNHNSKMTIDKY
ncbi:enoyl-CoA delta isomerase 1, peroxisomal-like [Coffea eugenioides]|uniref:enoyl-CoA delta isomerase 1, peroxisomal-like n=1 Tax=Coffea eugenioides TaxID=49369 RepID=UPI000F60DEB0|nr:enoyl-CoA delta isomerase 1, peroxisomal-like [Coffea eugenioides]